MWACMFGKNCLFFIMFDSSKGHQLPVYELDFLVWCVFDGNVRGPFEQTKKKKENK